MVNNLQIRSLPNLKVALKWCSPGQLELWKPCGFVTLIFKSNFLPQTQVQIRKIYELFHQQWRLNYLHSKFKCDVYTCCYLYPCVEINRNWVLPCYWNVCPSIKIFVKDFFLSVIIKVTFIPLNSLFPVKRSDRHFVTKPLPNILLSRLPGTAHEDFVLPYISKNRKLTRKSWEETSSVVTSKVHEYQKFIKRHNPLLSLLGHMWPNAFFPII